MSSKFSSHPGMLIDAAFTIGAESANVINVAIQLTDRLNGNEVGDAVGLFWYLSSDASGQSIASAPSGGVAIGTDGLLQEWTTNVSGLVTCETDGDIDINITETGDPSYYLNLVMPDGKLITSGEIDFVSGPS